MNAKQDGLARAIGIDPARREKCKCSGGKCADAHLEGKHEIASFVVGILGLNIGGDLVAEFIQHHKSTLDVLHVLPKIAGKAHKPKLTLLLHLRKNGGEHGGRGTK